MDNPIEEPEGLQRVRADATARGIAVEIRPRPHARDIEEAAQLLGITTGDIAKTVVMRAGADQYVFVVVPGDASAAFPKLRALLGVNKLKFPSADEVLAATGFERGTITPLGSAQPYPTYVDASLRGRRLHMGSGAHGYTAVVEADDLVRGLDATVADLIG